MKNSNLEKMLQVCDVALQYAYEVFENDPNSPICQFSIPTYGMKKEEANAYINQYLSEKSEVQNYLKKLNEQGTEYDGIQADLELRLQAGNPGNVSLNDLYANSYFKQNLSQSERIELANCLYQMENAGTKNDEIWEEIHYAAKTGKKLHPDINEFFINYYLSNPSNSILETLKPCEYRFNPNQYRTATTTA